MDDKILIDFERMKYPNNGLYQFSVDLGKSLVKEAANPEQLYFYLPHSAINSFGNKSNYVTQHSFHKFYFPGASRFRVWHATHQGTAYYPFSAKARKVLTVHDINFMHDDSKTPYKRARDLKALKKKVLNADYITSISEFVMKDLMQYVDIPPDRRRVIYNGCRINEIADINMPVVKPHAPFLFTIGVISPKKNFHVLPALLVNNDMQLIISGVTGNPHYKNKIFETAKSMGVEKRIIFTGPVSENDKQWYYKNCEAFVFPSKAEGFGLPVLEAMYFGKPAILSTLSSLPEIGGTQAYYFKNFDPDHMRKVLTNSLEQYYRYKPIDLIREQALSFSWDKSAQQYLEVYKIMGR